MNHVVWHPVGIWHPITNYACISRTLQAKAHNAQWQTKIMQRYVKARCMLLSFFIMDSNFLATPAQFHELVHGKALDNLVVEAYFDQCLARGVRCDHLLARWLWFLLECHSEAAAYPLLKHSVDHSQIRIFLRLEMVMVDDRPVEYLGDLKPVRHAADKTIPGSRAGEKVPDLLLKVVTVVAVVEVLEADQPEDFLDMKVPGVRAGEKDPDLSLKVEQELAGGEEEPFPWRVFGVQSPPLVSFYMVRARRSENAQGL